MEQGATLSGSLVTMTNGRPQAVKVFSSSATYPAKILSNTLNLSVGSSGAGDPAIYLVSGDYIVCDGNQLLFTSGGGYLANGIYLVNNNHCDITNNMISNVDKGIDHNADWTTITGNVVEDCIYGIRIIGSSNLTVHNNTIVRASCSSTTYGIWTDSSPGTIYSFEFNLVENLGTGFLFNTNVQGGWTIHHNAYWSDAGSCGSASNKSLDATQVATTLEPRFCAAHEAPVGEYTQRIDSGTAPGNNGWGELIGALGVECAWGALAISTTVPENAEALILEDLTIPNNKTLTLQPGAALKFDEDDNAGGGAFNNELIVTGTLAISGNSGNHAKLESSLANAPDSAWAGIVFNNGASGTLSYGDVRDCTVGLTSLNAGAVNVSHCLFENNKTLGMNLKRGNGSNLVVQNNTINVGEGVGIAFESTSAGGGHTISGNTFTLSSGSDKGLALVGSAPSKEIYDNAFSGGWSAFGIEVTGEGDWKLEHNTFTSCGVGVREERNSERLDLTGTIGGSGVGDRNTITYCTTGISLEGANVKPLIRYNDLSHNSNGVIIRTNAVPSLYTNTFLYNTSHCIYNQTSTTIDANGNYFGDIPNCDTTWVPGCGSGPIDFGEPLCMDPSGSLVEMIALSNVPLVIDGVFPNPIRSEGVIRFSIAKPHDVMVRIYDLSGRVIRNLGESSLGAGNHYAAWNGKDDQGQNVGSGIYFARVTAGGTLEKTAKLLVTR
jgi:parallel beta-helix repeat protein